jgi:anti-anti-sigma factor
VQQRALDVEQVGEVVLARISRPLGKDNEVLAVGEALFDLLDRDGCRKLVVSLAGAEGVGTAMLGKLILLHKKAEAAGGRLALCGIGPELYPVLAVARLTQLFSIYGDEQEAALSFCGPAAGSTDEGASRPAPPSASNPSSTKGEGSMAVRGEDLRG